VSILFVRVRALCLSFIILSLSFSPFLSSSRQKSFTIFIAYIFYWIAFQFLFFVSSSMASFSESVQCRVCNHSACDLRLGCGCTLHAVSHHDLCSYSYSNSHFTSFDIPYCTVQLQYLLELGSSMFVALYLRCVLYVSLELQYCTVHSFPCRLHRHGRGQRGITFPFKLSKVLNKSLRIPNSNHDGT